MSDWYFSLLRYPKLVLVTCLVVCLATMSGIRHFSFDASADTLVVDGDPALEKYNQMAAIFGGDDFIVLTYTHDDLFSDTALDEIESLQQQLAELPGISTTYSILDAPLIESPPIPLEHIAEDYRTLRDRSVDRSLAMDELANSPLMSDYLIARNGKSTAISATLKRDEMLELLREAKDEARQRGDGIAETRDAYLQTRSEYVANRDNLIQSLREVRDSYSGEATIFISGVPMIAADMLSYVRSDLQIFSALVLALIIILLTFFFRKPRWVAIPILICLTTVGITMGLLGIMRTPVTVVSSNFISLLSIISISFSIHLVVRYRELLARGGLEHEAMVKETMRSKFTPCLYTALTTLLAFGSMLGSSILPIEDFGWMMCLGIIIALIITYVLFPTILLIIGPTQASKTIEKPIILTNWFEHLSVNRTGWVLAVSAVLTLPAIYGTTLITFDNRFIDYFHEDTDIHQGMTHIDEHLGGTLPLDVYLQFEQHDDAAGDFFDDFEDEYPERYWYTPDKLESLRTLQQALEERPEVGKVISLASMEQMARRFNDGDALTGLEITYVLGELPQDVRDFLIEPYGSPTEGWMRINARIKESQTEFSKQDLIDSITRFAREEMALDDNRFIVTGMVVLFNDMLKQLADSQARTLGYVIIATFIMFSILLRSLRLALIALMPNVLAATMIIAFMGYAGIPLDMMTVTIAAICIGIGVDDAIHYLHRFREETDRSLSAREAVITSHNTIGHAMYFTTMTIMGGFSILALSNFVPTIYFGLLTALAMALALVANMTIMPALLLKFFR
ncbi:MAG: MMPL family transporter [Pseudomonadales bacterium]|jgi:predicted RND superfamily exporter protein|nr:MMPL family transporter [Pseudomonadales bacterium]